MTTVTYNALMAMQHQKLWMLTVNVKVHNLKVIWKTLKIY